MSHSDILGGVQRGLQIGSAFEQGRARREKRKAGKAEIAQQKILGGLRNRSLGLGGGTIEDQQLARKELLSEDPIAAGKFFSAFKQLPTPEQDKKKQQNAKIGLAAANLGQLSDDQFVAGINQTAQAFRDSGDEQLAEQAIEIAQQAETDPSGARLRLSALETQARDIEKVLSGKVPEVQKEFLKEERQQARTSVNKLTKRAVDINTASDRINSLLNQGTRAANASTFQLVARLASPGIVTEKEAGALAGGAAGIAALATLFDDRGAEDVGDLIRKSIDPNNPDLFDVEGMRNLTKALISSEVPFLLEELEGAKSRALTANISKTAFDTNFSADNIKSITSLSRFVKAKVKSAEALGGFNELTPEKQARLKELELEAANVGG